jgi:ribosomal-protein-alanine N-acetyltransferase
VKSVKAPIHIDTARLVLQQPTITDAAAIFERYASDREVTRFVGWPRHRSVEDTRAFLRFSAEEWTQWPAGPYLIRSRREGQLLGGTGFGFESPHQAMTGYVLARDAWGQGYATEALEAIIEIARRIGVARLYALCHPAHRASWRVLEKCAFARHDVPKRQAEFPNLSPGVQQDVLCYAMVLGTANGAG